MRAPNRFDTMFETEVPSMVQGLESRCVAAFRQRIDWSNFHVELSNFQNLKGRWLSILPLCVINHREADYDDLQSAQRYSDIDETRYVIFFENTTKPRDRVFKRWRFENVWQANIADTPMKGHSVLKENITRNPHLIETIRAGFFEGNLHWRMRDYHRYPWVKVFLSDLPNRTVDVQNEQRRNEISNIESIIGKITRDGARYEHRDRELVPYSERYQIKLASDVTEAEIEIAPIRNKYRRAIVTCRDVRAEYTFDIGFMEFDPTPTGVGLVHWPNYSGCREQLRLILNQVRQHLNEKGRLSRSVT